MNQPNKFSSPKSGEKPISVTSFYGNQTCVPLKIDRPSKPILSDYAKINHLPHRLNNLLGPSQIWKVFHKQNDALEYAKTKRSGLMTFAFQQWDGTRMFLVAHPKIFWHYDNQKDPSQRCSYEIIPESCACKLYFDLEFEIEYNKEKRGNLVVDNFISLVLYFISVLFNVKASREDILHLDSSTNVKFSRHLVFVLQTLVFDNNRSVGEFVDFICQKIKLYLMSCNDLETGNEGDDIANRNNKCKCCQLLSPNNLGCVKDIGISRENLRNMIVFDRKGKEQFICDCGVYSRNRHFRLFQNTKWKKNAPLLLSKYNMYKPKIKPKGKTSDLLYSEALFLDSLISNVEFQQSNVCDIRAIAFKNPLCEVERIYAKNLDKQLNNASPALKSTESSCYPEVDEFITSLVLPGEIRKSVYFSSSSVIVYEILGNRYCQNIGRQHRSNNVKYIVNLIDYTYYQKCHDPDCSEFRSSPILLPLVLRQKLEQCTCDPFESSDISDSELVEAVNAVEDLLSDEIA